MKRSEKKQLLNNWPNMSAEERQNILVQLEAELKPKKFEKLLKNIKKVEISIGEESSEYSAHDQQIDNANENLENIDNESLNASSNETSEEVLTEDNEISSDSHEEAVVVDQEESNNIQEDNIEHENEISLDDESHEEESVVVTEENVDDNLLNLESSEEALVDENEISLDDESHKEDEVTEEENVDDDLLDLDNQEEENWVIENNIIDVEMPQYNEKTVFMENPEVFQKINNEINKTSKEQIGSDERSWNKNKNIIYSQEELIYRLSNSNNIEDEEYKILLISAQKKIEFIQLLIEKSRMKNAAYSYDFLNSMCWRVDKALKIFLENNKR